MPCLAGCDDDPVLGGPCAYQDTPGTARIVSVEPAPDDGRDYCPDAVRVTFDFIPDSGSGAVSGRELHIGSGTHPPRAWVDSSGLAVGSEHPAVRSDITMGTCSPRIIKLTDVDYQAAWDAC